ncbi:MAG: V-type ATP synthase subunit F [Lachnospiraceae bacterium]|nr:V-type ATP synthase subunit F [Lachnospiraceae bacterium]
MHKIAVIGDYDSIYGFAAVGVSISPVKSAKEARTLLHRLAANQFGIIYITEEYADQIKEDIQKYYHKALPAIILIPGVSGNTGAGVENVKKTVEQAIGSDIVFSNK